MDRTEIAALAEGMVPFVRECVNEAVAEPIARIAVLEARSIEKGDAGEKGADGPQGPPGPKGDSGELAMVPSDLAEQIKSAIHLLHESQPIAKRDELVPRWPASPRVARIERDDDGNFVPIYAETQP